MGKKCRVAVADNNINNFTQVRRAGQVPLLGHQEPQERGDQEADAAQLRRDLLRRDGDAAPAGHRLRHALRRSAEAQPWQREDSQVQVRSLVAQW